MSSLRHEKGAASLRAPQAGAHWTLVLLLGVCLEALAVALGIESRAAAVGDGLRFVLAAHARVAAADLVPVDALAFDHVAAGAAGRQETEKTDPSLHRHALP